MRPFRMGPALRISLGLALFTMILLIGVDILGILPASHAVGHLWNNPLYKLLTLIVPIAFVVNYLLMRKTLQHRDPMAVIPERVKPALDCLVEGVVLMDQKERIVMANKVFKKTVGAANASLIGKKVSDMGWKHPESRRGVIDFPWQQAIRQAGPQAAVPMILEDTVDKVRTFMVNGAPILDGRGKMRCALATFDGVTKVETQDLQLHKTLLALKKTHDEIRRQNHELQILATQDSLTGCLNRRAFFERFEVEYSRARRYKHSLSGIMVDIDHFKSINDNHGHPMGDKVLQKVSAILLETVRDCDIVCRYGGEEFCVILPETATDGALITAERIRAKVAAEPVLGIQVTISLGVSSLEAEPENPSELLSQADKALYHAKTGGRNRVVGFSADIEDMPQSGAGEEKVRRPEENRPAPHTHIPYHVVQALMLALKHRDVATAEHSRQVGDLCAAAAQGLTSIEACSMIETAGLLHDIGKLGVPDSILFKPGPLTKAQWETMHDHKQRSVDVIASTFLCPELVEIVRYHGHWFDGSSSEDLSTPMGTDLPLGARILHIADSFHAMVSHRTYCRACSYEAAFAELRRCAGKQFDPDLVEHFIKVVRARDESRHAIY